MATWFCGECTTEYSVGAPRCPHCQACDPIREEEQLRRENEDMAKITVAAGASNVDAEPGEPGHVPTEGVEVEEGQESPAEEAVDGEEAAEAVDYNAFTVEELRAELADRDLPVSGNKPELVKRLAEDDGKAASTSVQAGVAEGSGGASS